MGGRALAGGRKRRHGRGPAGRFSLRHGAQRPLRDRAPRQWQAPPPPAAPPTCEAVHMGSGRGGSGRRAGTRHPTPSLGQSCVADGREEEAFSTPPPAGRAFSPLAARVPSLPSLPSPRTSPLRVGLQRRGAAAARAGPGTPPALPETRALRFRALTLALSRPRPLTSLPSSPPARHGGRRLLHRVW